MAHRNFAPKRAPLILPDSTAHTVTVTLDDGRGGPVNVSGSTWAADLEADDGLGLASRAITVGATNASTGVLTLDFTAADTAPAIIPNHGRKWRLRETTSGRRRTLYGGVATRTVDVAVASPTNSITKDYYQ